MTTAAGEAVGDGVEPQRLQWSHAWLGAESAGAWSGAVSAFPPLWQMTENGSTAAVAVRVACPPHKAECRAITVIATIPKSRLKRVRMLSSTATAVYQTRDVVSSDKFPKKCHGPCVFAADPLSL
jgi:hypothetical protein